ncbi:MAG: glycosyltransferase family 2 protein [Chloroflexota bacterium]
MRLAVIIVNYNTRDLLRDCLKSLEKTAPWARVFVVDNASDDGSAAMVADEFPDVTLLAQDKNTWFCGGNNIGIQAAKDANESLIRSYGLLLNPDTVVHRSAIETMVAFMGANPEYAGCTAQLRYPDGSVQRTCSRVPTFRYLLLNHTPLGALFPEERAEAAAHHWYDDEGFTREQSRDVEVMPGSCTLMRLYDLWLDDDLRLYFPEDDLAQRYQGKRFRFLAEATITHREKAATQSWLATRVYFRDMVVYTRKHHGFGPAILLWALTRPVWVGMWFASLWRRR